MEGEDKSAVNIDQFELLFRSNHKFLCMIAMQYVQDHFVAEDLVQEFFLDFWQRRQSITINGSFEAYARRAVKYKSIDYLRKGAVEEKRNGRLQVTVPEEAADVAAETEALELQHRRYLEIKDRIQELPEERRRIFMMHALEELSYAQIAEKKNVSVNTVKTQLRRAYMALRNKTVVLLMLFF